MGDAGGRLAPLLKNYEITVCVIFTPALSRQRRAGRVKPLLISSPLDKPISAPLNKPVSAPLNKPVSASLNKPVSAPLNKTNGLARSANLRVLCESTFQEINRKLVFTYSALTLDSI